MAHVERTVEEWEARTSFVFLLVDSVDDEVLGSGGIHRRAGPDVAEIGYWLRATRTGRRAPPRVARPPRPPRSSCHLPRDRRAL